MVQNSYSRRLGSVLFLSLIFALVTSPPAFPHGGVTFEEDLCVINIGFLTAHFTVYQPDTQGSKEFCEDIPDVAQSVFVMEYTHDFLQQMLVDFRIIEDVNDFGVFARWEDVQTIEDLEAATVFYQPPVRKADGSLTLNFSFEEKGTYIGIVSAQHPTEDRTYHSVFYFQVGGADFGTLPWFVLLAILLQLAYWLSNGGLERMKARKKAHGEQTQSTADSSEAG